MNKLGNDICRCHAAGCPLALTCLRYIQRYDIGPMTPAFVEEPCRDNNGWTFKFYIEGEEHCG